MAGLLDVVNKPITDLQLQDAGIAAGSVKDYVSGLLPYTPVPLAARTAGQVYGQVPTIAEKIGQGYSTQQAKPFTPSPEQFDAFGVDVRIPNLREEAVSNVEAGNGEAQALAESRMQAMQAFQRLNDPKVPNDPEDVKIVTDAQKEAAGEEGNVKLNKPENVDQGAWDSFNSEFDLTTIGLSLLATSANGQPLAANLGLALEAGKLAKTKEADKAESRAARAEKAKIDAEDRTAKKKEQAAKIKKLEAETNKIRAELKGELGGKYEAPNQTQIVTGQSFIANLVGADSYKDVPQYLGDAYYDISQKIRASGDSNPKSIQDRALNQMMKLGYFEDTSWFGDPNFEIASVLGNQ